MEHLDLLCDFRCVLPLKVDVPASSDQHRIDQSTTGCRLVKLQGVGCLLGLVQNELKFTLSFLGRFGFGVGLLKLREDLGHPSFLFSELTGDESLP